MPYVPAKPQAGTAKQRYLILAVGISVVGHFGMLSCFYFCALGLQLGDLAPGYWTHLLLIPGASALSAEAAVPDSGCGNQRGGTFWNVVLLLLLRTGIAAGRPRSRLLDTPATHSRRFCFISRSGGT